MPPKAKRAAFVAASRSPLCHRLPGGFQAAIFSYCDAHELVRLRLVCSTLRREEILEISLRPWREASHGLACLRRRFAPLVGKDLALNTAEGYVHTMRLNARGLRRSQKAQRALSDLRAALTEAVRSPCRSLWCLRLLDKVFGHVWGAPVILYQRRQRTAEAVEIERECTVLARKCEQAAVSLFSHDDVIVYGDYHPYLVQFDGEVSCPIAVAICSPAGRWRIGLHRTFYQPQHSLYYNLDKGARHAGNEPPATRSPPPYAAEHFSRVLREHSCGTRRQFYHWDAPPIQCYRPLIGARAAPIKEDTEVLLNDRALR